MKATLGMCQTPMLVADDDLLSDLEQLIESKTQTAGGAKQMARYAIPRQTDERMNSTNGFTIGKRYPLLWWNDHVARVSNDNGHERVIPLDGSSTAHLQYRRRETSTSAGYFEIGDTEENGGV